MLVHHNGLAFIINTTGDISKSWVTGMIPKLAPQMSFTTDPWSISGQVTRIELLQLLVKQLRVNAGET